MNLSNQILIFLSVGCVHYIVQSRLLGIGHSWKIPLIFQFPIPDIRYDNYHAPSSLL